MYKKFYGLVEKPFNVTPDPRFIYLGKHHQEALAHLTYGIAERKGFIVITGEVGTGKTTLIHTLLERLDEGVKTALIFNPNLTLEDFFLSLFDEFGLKVQNPTKANFLIELNNFLIERLSRNENAVLIIDEAQNLSPSILEEIRLLLNLETSKDKLLQIVLSGQPELNRKLDLPELRQLKQRISVRYHIPPLNRKEVEEYIRGRLKAAGAKDFSIFTDKAVEEIFNYSKGIPRLINILCDNSLLAGYATDQREIDHKIVSECIGDLELKGKSPKETIEVAPGTPEKSHRLRLKLLVFALFFMMLVLAGNVWWNTESYRETWTMLQGKEKEVVPSQSRLDPTSPPWRGQIQPESAQKEISHEVAFKDNSVGWDVQPAAEIGQRLVTEVGQKPAAEVGQASSPVYKDKSESSLISQDQYVTVKENDWLSEIVLKRYGKVSEQILSFVKKSNPEIKDVNHIEAGWKVFLPEFKDTLLKSELFSVHIASFREFTDASALFSRMAKEDYEVYLIPVSISNKGHWYRVTLGRFKNEKGAAQYAGKLLADRKFQYAMPLHIEKSEAMEIER